MPKPRPIVLLVGLLCLVIVLAAAPRAAEDRIEVYRDERTGQAYIRLEDAQRLAELLLQQDAEIKRLKRQTGCL